MAEAKQEVEIVNQRGLHARASAKFVAAVSQFSEDLQVKVAKDGTAAAGGSILGLMMLGAGKGDRVTIMVEGDDADSALMKLVQLVASGFGEE